MNKTSIIPIILILVAYGSFSQNANSPKDKDPFKVYFYPPELVVQYKEEIKLTAEQESYIRKEYQDASGEFNNLNLDLRAAHQKLQRLIQDPIVNEQAAIEQLQEVLVLEHNIKQKQLTVFIRIKNKLTEEQKKQLDSFK